MWRNCSYDLSHSSEICESPEFKSRLGYVNVFLLDCGFDTVHGEKCGVKVEVKCDCPPPKQEQAIYSRKEKNSYLFFSHYEIHFHCHHQHLIPH